MVQLPLLRIIVLVLASWLAALLSGCDGPSDTSDGAPGMTLVDGSTTDATTTVGGQDGTVSGQDGTVSGQDDTVRTTTIPRPEYVTVPRTKEADAEFLIKATFGPTRASLAELGNEPSYESWIDRQLKLPAETHRPYYRARVNSQTDIALHAGAPRQRCAVGSRFHRFAFTLQDVGKPISVQNGQVFVDGDLRTDIDPAREGNELGAAALACSDDAPPSLSSCSQRALKKWDCRFNQWWRTRSNCKQSCYAQGLGYDGDDCSSDWVGLSFEGFVCSVSEAVGGVVALEPTNSCRGAALQGFKNPALWFQDAGRSTETSSLFETLKPGVILLAQTSEPPCNLGSFIKTKGDTYRHQSRMELLRNTLESPAAGVFEVCPSVPRNPFNAKSCKLTSTCFPLSMIRSEFQLNSTSLALFFTSGRNYVYSIANLQTTEPPCKTLARWKQLDCSSESCQASPGLSDADVAAVAAALETQSGWLRDVQADCTSIAANSVVQSGTAYWQHVHLHEYNVYDFTAWAEKHPGGADKIQSWAKTGTYQLQFPSHHSMERWQAAQSTLRYVGRLGDYMNIQDLPAQLESQRLANALSAGSGATYFQACGSPGEEASDPKKGHTMAFYSDFESVTPEKTIDENYDEDNYFSTPGDSITKTNVWLKKALEASDQLRQRAAWALSQIFVAGKSDHKYNELWINYYDILVRNALGNFRDVLREVTYSSVMGDYLTYKGSTSFDHSNTYPDENYAREIMQLFTIGLFKLNPDGSRQFDAVGNVIPTYDNTNIMDFARVFTGFDELPNRGNYEDVKGHPNLIDPMRMRADRHDAYPKSDLNGGYLGDGYPLCSDLPAKSFLGKGSSYEFLGPIYDGSGVLVLEQGSSLRAALCGQSSASASACSVQLNKVLEADLTCHGQECMADIVSVVKVDGGYYRFVPPSCVHLFFYNGQKTAEGGRRFLWDGFRKCSNPLNAAAGVSCCAGCPNKARSAWSEENITCENSAPNWLQARCNAMSNWRKQKFCQLACWENGVGYDGDDCSAGAYREKRVCSSPKELVRLAAAETRCADLGMSLCPARTGESSCDYEETQVWLPGNCSLEVAVYPDGKVASQADDDAKQNRFTVKWVGGAHPTAQSCLTECRVSGEVCICSLLVEERPIFDKMPSSQDLQERMKIGALRPASSCSSSGLGEVKACLGTSQSFDKWTVFEYQGMFFRNVESMVRVAGYEFRNPPAFLDRSSPTEKAALDEVEALLDHLFHHDNTPVFISYRLIQRFVTSNPSGDYLQSVAQAFKTGAYEGKTYSGLYGDISATLAAILLHPEAQSSQTSVSNGALREPIIKIVHLLRSMEFSDRRQRDQLIISLQESTGQSPFEAPSVFNFYRPGYQPASFEGTTVAPEFQIFTPPYFLSLLNGMMSIIQHRGLSDCDSGFGIPAPNCSQASLLLEETGSASDTIEELNLLLTGGRLSNTEAIRKMYDAAEPGKQLEAAQLATVMTPEFHTLGSPQPKGRRSEAVRKERVSSRPYKALVNIFLDGGADTFNMLVPMKCDLYTEYLAVRGNVALQPFQLHEIGTLGQACSKFGIHHKMPYLKKLYDEKKAAFVSNIGALVEPLTREDWKKAGKARCVGLFSHSDQTDAAMTLECQTSGAGPKGAGGRIADALASGSNAFATSSFSIDGTSVWAQGRSTQQEIVHRRHGFVRLNNYENVRDIVGNVTSFTYDNLYSEEYAKQFLESVKMGEEQGAMLDNASLTTEYSAESFLAQQLMQVAKLISARAVRKAERDVFYVRMGGFDTHSDMAEELEELYGSFNAALEGFVSELEGQGILDSVTVITSSDFGRSLTSNGRGTDHAWAGNHIVVGGSLQGGRVFNDFPTSLLEGSLQDAGRGRLIPKYPWENMMVPIAQWMGVDSSQMSSVFPNLGRFNATTHLIKQSSLFKA
eukprot:TRINITY_DN4129_c0_g1_i1.p1 TRINITY_DN4129_c0_g1~~TRINITY_DN4129_c0_g1_i1.p1  ORF type:complete len:1919 (+),score=336.86 TRINITY_DN4129_c0_g1_i1:71-5827(+)